MQKTKRILMAALLICWTGLSGVPLHAEGVLGKVIVTHPELNLQEGSTAEIAFDLSESCAADVFITDVTGNIVRNLIAEETRGSGRSTERWDGKDDYGNPVGNGIYFPIIQCTTKRKGTEIYNPSSLPWGIQIVTNDISYQNQTQLVGFEVESVTYGRLRVGLKEGGPVYKTLTPWRLWRPGRHEIQWDGRDIDDQHWVINQEHLSYSFDAFTLPPNTIIVTDADERAPLIQPQYGTFPIHPPSGGSISYFALEAGSQGGEPELAIDWPRAKKKKGAITLKGYAKCTVSFADPNTRSSVMKAGSELILYVDDVYVAETPVEHFPASIGFDTGAYPNGEHLVTINLLTTDDRAGIAVHKVAIDNN